MRNEMIEEAYGCIAEAERAFLESGDEAAFEYIVLHYMGGLLGFVYKTTCDFHLAEDVVQDCFSELWLNRRRFRGKSSLKTYLYSMGHNLATHALRGRRKEVSVSELDSFCDGGDTVHEQFTASERERAIHSALASLRSPDREVIYLRYFEQMSYEEIGRILKLTTKKLYKTAERAKRSLAMDIEI